MKACQIVSLLGRRTRRARRPRTQLHALDQSWPQYFPSGPGLYLRPPDPRSRTPCKKQARGHDHKTAKLSQKMLASVEGVCKCCQGQLFDSGVHAVTSNGFPTRFLRAHICTGLQRRNLQDPAIVRAVHAPGGMPTHRAPWRSRDSQSMSYFFLPAASPSACARALACITIVMASRFLRFSWMFCSSRSQLLSRYSVLRLR